MTFDQTLINRTAVWRLLILNPLGGFLCMALLMGCSDKVGAPVSLPIAQEILEAAMEGWKEGKSPKDLLAEKPSIVVQEREWNGETKLLDYEILSNDKPTGPNLIATVKLKLSQADGKVIEKTATYVVGTSPGLTVYRNTMR